VTNVETVLKNGETIKPEQNGDFAKKTKMKKKTERVEQLSQQ